MKATRSIVASTLLVACAVTSSAVFAASTVTLYGIIDTDITYLNHQAIEGGRSGAQFAMASAGEYGSRFGLRGNEDLGGGMNALFVLEQGFNGTNGAATDGTRQWSRLAYVGLSTPYGVVTLGRQYSAYFDAIQPFAPQGRSVTFEPYKLMMNDYVDNSIKYAVGYRGLKFTGMAAMGNVAGNFRASAVYSLGLNYTRGGFSLGLGADQSNTVASTTVPLGSVGAVQRLSGAARYQWDKATLYAGYKWQKTESAAQVTTQRDAVYWTGVRYAFVPELQGVLAYYYQDLQYVAGQHLANPQQATAQLTYLLSKSTAVYAAVSETWHAAIDLASVSTLAPGHSNQLGVAVGFRHAF